MKAFKEELLGFRNAVDEVSVLLRHCQYLISKVWEQNLIFLARSVQEVPQGTCVTVDKRG